MRSSSFYVDTALDNQMLLNIQAKAVCNINHIEISSSSITSVTFCFIFESECPDKFVKVNDNDIDY